MRLSEAALETRAELHGADVRFLGCTTDSRAAVSGQLFIALRGERFDGHDFIRQAVAAGAVAYIGEAADAGCPAPMLKVAETRAAMSALAASWRNRFKIPVIAVTGSNGKTTVKEMLQRILSLAAPVIATRGNLNNEIGVPLTLFQLGADHRYAVVEMGASAPGEIQKLARLARPTVAVITQCAPAHLEGFGSVAGVARAKAEIYAGLPADGAAIINLDDGHAPLWLKETEHLRQIRFGMDPAAEVRALDLRIDPETGESAFSLAAFGGSVTLRLALVGRHNVTNALAAAACCLALGIGLDTIRSGLEAMRPVPGRLQIKAGIRHSRIYDDTYNANPGSLVAAMQTVGSLPGRNWLALGDMAELGPGAADFHLEAGEQARRYGFERLYAFGVHSVQAVAGFGQGARHFADKAELIAALRSDLQEGVRVLVKGSRSMAMEGVVAKLAEGN
ncbi:MAG: UDP-N-acetylmuramoyl-tripeptide--D-alanyl-D-alanine ligase [Gammaproteobacteria bacterium]|nr:MAG: UDP-N-acetylmuramoyl-tripeptide--D-alanyl-D-alanine ligase [Gammaproteobacteria bacterium]